MKSSQKLPETVLWDYLDRCGIDFRLSQASLIDKFGHRNCGWTEGLEYCELGGKPFLDGLVHPLVFQFQPGFDLSPPPMSLFSYIRQSSDWSKNLDIAVKQLESHFGPGEDTSVSNTKSKRWVFGGAFIEATAFPPDLNKGMGHNHRHGKIPGSKTECSIEIETRYCFVPTDQERAWIDSYEWFYTPSQGSGPVSGLYYFGPLSRDTQQKSRRKHGEFGFSRDNQALIAWYEGRYVEILPISWISDIHYTRMTPARGAGGESVSVAYKPPTPRPGLTQSEPAHFTLMSKYGDLAGMDKAAQKLANRLDIPLTESEYPDS